MPGPLGPPTAASAQNLCWDTGSAVAAGAIASSTWPAQGPPWCWDRLLTGYRHDHSKLVLTGGGHALASSLYLTDGAMEVSQVTGQGPLVHCREGNRAS